MHRPLGYLVMAAACLFRKGPSQTITCFLRLLGRYAKLLIDMNVYLVTMIIIGYSFLVFVNALQTSTEKIIYT